MNKKFLSIFALTALLLAAIAGAAFADAGANENPGNVSGIYRVDDPTNSLGPFIINDAEAEVDVYYLSKANFPLKFKAIITAEMSALTGGEAYSYQTPISTVAGTLGDVKYTPAVGDLKDELDHFTAEFPLTYTTVPQPGANNVISNIGVTIDGNAATPGKLTINLVDVLAKLDQFTDPVLKHQVNEVEIRKGDVPRFLVGDGLFVFGDLTRTINQGGLEIERLDLVPFELAINLRDGNVSIIAGDITTEDEGTEYELKFKTTKPIKYSFTDSAKRTVPVAGGENGFDFSNSVKVKIVGPEPKLKFTPVSGIETDTDYYGEYFFVRVGTDLKAANAAVKVELLNAKGYSVKSVDVVNYPGDTVTGKGSAGPVFTLEGMPKTEDWYGVRIRALIVDKSGNPATNAQLSEIDIDSGLFEGLFWLRAIGPEVVFDPVTIPDATVDTEYPATNVKLSIAGVTPAPTITKVEVTPRNGSVDGIDVTASAPGASPYIRFSGTPAETGYVSADVTVTYKNASGDDVVVENDRNGTPFVLKVNEKTYGLGFSIADERFAQNDDGSFAIDISEVDGVLEELEVALVVADQPVGSAINDVELGFLGGGVAANLDAAGGKKLTLNSDGLKAGEVSFDVTVTLEDALGIELDQKAFGRFVLAITSGDVPPPPAEYTLSLSAPEFDAVAGAEFETSFDITVLDKDGEPVDSTAQFTFDATTEADWLTITPDDAGTHWTLTGTPEEAGAFAVDVTAAYLDPEVTVEGATFTINVTEPQPDFFLKFDPEALTVTEGDEVYRIVSFDLGYPDGYAGNAAFGEIKRFLVAGDAVGFGEDDIALVDGEYAFAIDGRPTAPGTVTVDVEIALVDSPQETVSATFELTVAPYVPPTPDPVAVEPVDASDVTIDGVTILDPAAVSVISNTYPAPTGNALSAFNATGALSSILVDIEAAENEAVAFTLTVEEGTSAILDAIQNMQTEAEMIAALDRSMDIYYDYVDANGVSTGAPAHLVGRGGLISWQQAYDGEIVEFFEDGSVEVNYIIVNGVGDPTTAGRFLVVYDGIADDKILDPMILTNRKADSSSGSSGCDAGFGAFALLSLAGMALLRKKD